MLLREPIAEREFPEWTLGFETVASAEAGRLLGKHLLFDPAAPVAGIDAESFLTLATRRRSAQARLTLRKRRIATALE